VSGMAPSRRLRATIIQQDRSSRTDEGGAHIREAIARAAFWAGEARFEVGHTCSRPRLWPQARCAGCRLLAAQRELEAASELT
jgi:hypothetical protein